MTCAWESFWDVLNNKLKIIFRKWVTFTDLAAAAWEESFSLWETLQAWNTLLYKYTHYTPKKIPYCFVKAAAATTAQSVKKGLEKHTGSCIHSLSQCSHKSPAVCCKDPQLRAAVYVLLQKVGCVCVGYYLVLHHKMASTLTECFIKTHTFPFHSYICAGK